MINNINFDKTEQDEILFDFFSCHGETDENITAYKNYRAKTCEAQAIKQRFKFQMNQLFIYIPLIDTINSKLKSLKSQFYLRGIRMSLLNTRNFKRKGCSVRIEEPMDHHSIIKTHKELFCRRCEIYDCQTHGIMEVYL